MCYAKPGPRCSSHAKKDLDRARAARETLHAECAAMREGFYADLKAYEEANPASGSDDFYAAHPYGIAMQKSIGALDALRHAEAAYDATPAGMADLNATMAAREEAVGDAVLTDRAYQIAKRRLERGQQTRKDQLEAHRQVLELTGKTTPPAGAGHEAEDEETALAPPPPCTCIEYRNKSDCAHLTARVEKARQTLLPTSQEASLALHTAQSRERTLRGQWLAKQTEHGVDHTKDAAAYQAARDADPALKTAEEDLTRAMNNSLDAARDFYSTPAGRALLQDRIERRTTCVDGGPHYFGGWEGFLRDAREHRDGNRATFEERTGQPAPADDEVIGSPPDLMYGNGCSQGCNNFKWTGRCPHTDAEWGRHEAIIGMIRQTPEVKAMTKIMEKEFGPKKPSRLKSLLYAKTVTTDQDEGGSRRMWRNRLTGTYSSRED